MAPVYLATMAELESKDEVTWNYLKQNFSISKTSIPFVATGSDHAMEQENKAMKLLGRVTGLRQQTSALNRFCLTAPLLSNLLQEFLLRNNIARYNRSYHYQLTGSTNDRIYQNKSKLISLLDSFSTSFAPSENVANLVSKAVFPVTTADNLLNHKETWLEMYKDFIINKINSPMSLWSPMKKQNLKLFKVQVKSIKSKSGEKIIQLKEEKNLVSRFLITARKRTELMLERCVGDYEFSVVPKSLITEDGVPLAFKDKLTVMDILENLENLEVQLPGNAPYESAIIIDGMSVVNEIVKDKSMKTCKVSIFQTMKNIYHYFYTFCPFDNAFSR